MRSLQDWTCLLESSMSITAVWGQGNFLSMVQIQTDYPLKFFLGVCVGVCNLDEDYGRERIKSSSTLPQFCSRQLLLTHENQHLGPNYVIGVLCNLAFTSWTGLSRAIKSTLINIRNTDLLLLGNLLPCLLPPTEYTQLKAHCCGVSR